MLIKYLFFTLINKEKMCFQFYYFNTKSLTCNFIFWFKVVGIFFQHLKVFLSYTFIFNSTKQFFGNVDHFAKVYYKIKAAGLFYYFLFSWKLFFLMFYNFLLNIIFKFLSFFLWIFTWENLFPKKNKNFILIVLTFLNTLKQTKYIILYTI